jgi:hypothetical protein
MNTDAKRKTPLFLRNRFSKSFIFSPEDELENKQPYDKEFRSTNCQGNVIYPQVTGF